MKLKVHDFVTKETVYEEDLYEYSLDQALQALVANAKNGMMPIIEGKIPLPDDAEVEMELKLDNGKFYGSITKDNKVIKHTPRD